MATTKENMSKESSKTGQIGQHDQKGGVTSTTDGSEGKAERKKGGNDSMHDQSNPKEGVRDTDSRQERPDRPDRPGIPDRPENQKRYQDDPKQFPPAPMSENQGKNQGKNKGSKMLGSDDEDWMDIDPEANRKTPSSTV
jgi:hypothetical protein